MPTKTAKQRKAPVKMSGALSEKNSLPPGVFVCAETSKGAVIAKTNMRAIKIVLFFFIGFLLQSTVAFSQVSNSIPLYHPVYEQLERLQGKELFPKYSLTTRPVTEAYLSFLLEQSQQSNPEIEAYLTTRKSPGVDLYFGFIGTNSKSTLLPQMDARIHPAFEQSNGRFDTGGFTAWAEPRFGFSWGGWGAIDVSPMIPVQWSNEGERGRLRARIQEASLKLGHGDFEIQAGRFPVRWGHGKSGGLIIGGSQYPMDQIQIRNTIPTELPSVLKHLGPIQFSAILARLSGSQRFPHSFFSGARMTIHPFTWFELGYNQAVILGGDGAPELSFTEGIVEVLGRRTRDQTQSNNSNRNGSLDGRIIFPRGIELYAELFLEDCCGGGWLRDLSNMVGVLFPRQNAKDVGFRFEWVRTTEITYRNGIFTSGYADRGHSIGHPIGPDAMGFYLFTQYELSKDLEFELINSFERRGRNHKLQTGGDLTNRFPTLTGTEERWAFTTKTTWSPTSQLWVRGTLGYEHIEDFGLVSGDRRDHIISMLESGWTF